MRAERQILELPIHCIRQNENQPRKIFNQSTLLELSASIKEYGVLQPISVRRSSDTSYELIAGERRLRACQLAGMEIIPAIVVDITDTGSAVLAMIENLQREDLNYLEEAEGYHKLILEHSFTQEELANQIGKKQSTIANKLRILKLDDKVKQELINKNLTERHARALLKLESVDLQLDIINQIVEKDLNVKRTEELIEAVIEKQDEIEELENSKTKAKYKWSINPKIITNTLRQIMDKNGIEATYSHKEKDDCLEIIVKIPKK